MIEITIVLLLVVCLGFQVFYTITRKDVTDLYLSNKVILNKRHYVEHKVINGRLNIILVDSKTKEEYIVSKVCEKGLSTFFITEGYSYRYSSLFKKIDICKV